MHTWGGGGGGGGLGNLVDPETFKGSSLQVGMENHNRLVCMGEG